MAELIKRNQKSYSSFKEERGLNSVDYMESRSKVYKNGKKVLFFALPNGETGYVSEAAEPLVRNQDGLNLQYMEVQVAENQWIPTICPRGSVVASF